MANAITCLNRTGRHWMFFGTLLATIMMLGCGKKAIEADPAPFKTAVSQFLKSHAMEMKVHRFRTLHVDGDRATANVSLGHAGGATAIKVQWEFTFGKKGNVWQVESYRK